MKFELTDEQREYFGLDSIESNWDKVTLKGDSYRPESSLYFEGNTIKKHIISTPSEYKEVQYNEPTNNREFLLPKTGKGTEKRLTASVLESRQPIGVYCIIDSFRGIYLGNHTTQTTFYASRWELSNFDVSKDLHEWVEQYIWSSPENHVAEISRFKNAKRKHVKFKVGDFFTFKLSRTLFGFGRILLDIDKIRKKQLINKNHGLNLLMGPPVLYKIYAHVSEEPNTNITELSKMPSLPSSYIMDNRFYYGEYVIIGYQDLTDDDFEFPMSYGRNLGIKSTNVFLQWGLIHIEKPITTFDKYLSADNKKFPEDHPPRIIDIPYGYYSIGFELNYDLQAIQNTIQSHGVYTFDTRFKDEYDLRNPQNKHIRNEIMEAFGLQPDKGYEENRILTGTQKVSDVIKNLDKG
jgi:hypothetical protein